MEGVVRAASDQAREAEVKAAAEVAVFKEKNKVLSRQNRVFRMALAEMTDFFNSTLE